MRYLTFIITLTIILTVDNVYGQRFSSVVLRQVDKTDTLAKFLDVADIRTKTEEKEKHKIIWTISEVRDTSISLRRNGFEVFTMTEEGTNDDSKVYIIGLYKMLEGDDRRIATYRINKDLTIELYNSDKDKWIRLKVK
jgi:hypothetical protein